MWYEVHFAQSKGLIDESDTTMLLSNRRQSFATQYAERKYDIFNENLRFYYLQLLAVIIQQRVVIIL